MVTLKDVAKATGVSAMTVSNALRYRSNVSDETAKRIRAVAREMNYRIDARSMAASSLRRSAATHTTTIGIAISEIRQSWPAEFAAAVTDEAKARGFETLIEETRIDAHNEKTVISRISSQFYDGLIFSHSRLSPEQIDQLAQHRPTVLLDHTTPQDVLDTVLTDSRRGASAGIEYLAASGRRRILILGAGADGPRNAPGTDNQVRALRLGGCLDAMRDLGLPFDDASCLDIPWTDQASRQAVMSMGESIRGYDAVFCLSGMIAVGAIRALHDLRVGIPDEVAVMGMSGVNLDGYLSPSLTTVDLNIAGIAHAAVELLSSRISETVNGNSPARIVTVPSHIQRRESA